MRLEQTSIAQFTSMACVRLLDGTDVMTMEEYSVWRDELRGNEDEECFFDALRRNLAKRLRLQNFRRLALACGIGNLGPESPWGNTECLTAIVRQYVEAVTGEAEGLANGVDLLRAAERGDLQHVLELLEKPRDPNAIDTNSQRGPLHNAAANGHQAVVQCLLEAGADTEKADNDGFTPLHLAAQQSHHAVVQCLLDAGADKEKGMDGGATPLHFAALQGHHAVVQCLLDAGADKEKATDDGSTPLHLAAHQGHHAVAQCLLDAGADR
ncbi:unnamed protein product, partial [Effrenium voratum]